VPNDANGQHTGTVTVDTTGLAPGNYGVKVSVTHQGNGTNSDDNSVSIYSHATPTVPLTASNATYTSSMYTGASVGPFAGGAFGTTTLHYTGTAYDSDVAPTNAGTYTVTASYVSDGKVHGFTQYDNSSSSVAFTIAKAKATVAVTGYTGGTYDGAAHTQTVTVTGVEADGTLFSDSLSGTNAGGYSKDWSFRNDNYNVASGTPSFTIKKANAVIVVTGYTDTWNGIAHTATGSAKGVLGEALAGLDLSGTTHTGIRNYTDTWTFAGNENYNFANGSVTDKLNAPTASLFSTSTQGAVNVGKNGAITTTLTALNQADYDTVAALSSLTFRTTYTNSRGTVTLNPTLSSTTSKSLTVMSPDASLLVSLANSTGIDTTMTLEVLIDGVWYTLGTQTGIKIFSN
jgi:hypothetical protein